MKNSKNEILGEVIVDTLVKQFFNELGEMKILKDLFVNIEKNV